MVVSDAVAIKHYFLCLYKTLPSVIMINAYLSSMWWLAEIGDNMVCLILNVFLKALKVIDYKAVWIVAFPFQYHSWLNIQWKQIMYLYREYD